MPSLDFDLEALRAKFPILRRLVSGRPLTYLDNAATTQKPQAVMDSVTAYYSESNANVHRGVHALSLKATLAFDAVRPRLAAWLGVASPECIVWTKGCTEAINLVASAWGRVHLKPGDRVLLSEMEHHANLVPWQQSGARVEPIPISDAGELDLEEMESLLRGGGVKLVGLKHLCNALGTRLPLEEAIPLAHRYGARVLVDGAQGFAHERLNLAHLDVDFYTVSAHKAYGPTGVGALYVRPEILSELPPYQYGGDMVRTVDWDGTTFADAPHRFEAGTPNTAGVIGFGAALEFLERLPAGALAHEDALLAEATARLEEIPGVRIYGTAKRKHAVLSFTLEGVHAHDLGTILDGHGVAIRAGHHCCMPLMARLGIPATARASFAFYNSGADVAALIGGVREARAIFSGGVSRWT